MHERYAERLISQAIADGRLTPSVGTGEPLAPMSHDPDWWVRTLIEREESAPARRSLVRSLNAAAQRAAAEASLDAARAALGDVNDVALRWNERVAAAYRIAPATEIWLLTARARASGPAGGPDAFR